MADPQGGAVIIRDDAGTEHEFPAGFDPQRAAAIVRQQTMPTADAPRDDRGRPLVSSSLSDAPPSGIAQWFETKLRPMLEQVAHPQTIADIAALLIPDAGLTGTVRAGAKAVGAIGRGVEAATPTVEKAAAMVGPSGVAGGMFHGSPGTAAAIGTGAVLAPKVTAATGKVLQRAGGALERAAAEMPRPVVAEAAPAVAEAAAPAAVNEFSAARAARANTLPDQKALNEAALAARRAAYQASQVAAPAGPIVAASGKMKLTADEFKEFIRLTNKGMTFPDAEIAVKTMRALATKLGGATSAEVVKDIASRRYKS
jgi:hypothetical protein